MGRPRFTKRIRKIMSLDEFFNYAENFPIKTKNTNDFKNGGRLVISGEIHYYLRAMDLFLTKEEIEKYHREGNENDSRWMLGYAER